MSDVLCVIPKVPGRAGQYHQLTPPLGLAWIGAVLEREGISVRIVDLQIEEGFAQILAHEKPRLICISGASESRFEAFCVAAQSKKFDSNIVVAYGGPHATFTPGDTLANVQEIDVVGRGEGEYTVLELARAVLDDRLDMLSHIKGISYRKNGHIVHNEARERIRNLDELPFPARHLLNMNRYKTKMEIIGAPGESIITSRGCPIGCTFCSASHLWGRWYTMRSPENVLDEIELLIDQYKIQGIKFFDSTLTLNRKHIESLCDAMMERGIHLPWECEVRADTAEEELFRKMRKAGCYLIDIGIESGNASVLKRIKKKITVEQALSTIKWARNTGLKTKVFLLYGLPGETPREAWDTVELARGLRDKVDILYKPSPVKIYPGTGVECYAREKNLLPKGFEWSRKFHERKNLELNQTPLIPLLIQPQFDFDDFLQFEKGMTNAMYPVYRISPGYLFSILKSTKTKDEAVALANKVVRKLWWTLHGSLWGRK